MPALWQNNLSSKMAHERKMQVKCPLLTYQVFSQIAAVPRPTHTPSHSPLVCEPVHPNE